VHLALDIVLDSAPKIDLAAVNSDLVPALTFAVLPPHNIGNIQMIHLQRERQIWDYSSACQLTWLRSSYHFLPQFGPVSQSNFVHRGSVG